MFEKVKDFFDNLSAEDRQNKSSVDFNQSIDKIRPPKNNDDLEDILLAEKTSDDGGIIAMTGFYYQMMVAVLYLGEVIQGNWGNGELRRAKLENAGYNYYEVQKEVNRLLKSK